MADANPLAKEDIGYIQAVYMAGLKYRDIALAIDRPIGTVKTAVHRLIRDGVVFRRNAEIDRIDG